MSEFVMAKRELYDRVIARLDDDGWYGLTDELRAVLAQEACENCDGTGGVKKYGGSDSCPDCKGSGLSASPSTPAPVSVAIPRISGIGRDIDHPKALVLYLGKVPDEGDIRAIQDALRTPSERTEPVSMGAAKSFAKGFNTLETGGGKYKIVMQFSGHDDAWAAYTALGKIQELNQ